MAWAVDLAPQEIDEDLEVVAADVAVAPHGIEQPIPCDDSPRGFRQALQDRELGSGELQLTTGPRDGSCGEIDRQVREAKTTPERLASAIRVRARTRARSTASENGLVT